MTKDGTLAARQGKQVSRAKCTAGKEAFVNYIHSFYGGFSPAG